MVELFERSREVVRRRGLVPTVRLAAERYAPGSSWSDEYLWYERPTALPAGRELDDGLVLRRGGPADLGLLDQLPRDPEVTILTEAILRRRLESGADHWLVVEGDRLAFSCFTFTGRAPLTGIASEVGLPDGIVLLEDSVSSTAFRGRGVAAAAWSAIAGHHRDRGARALITKVRVENAAVRRALEKAGFSQAATMRRWSRLGRIHVGVMSDPGAQSGAWLSSLSR